MTPKTQKQTTLFSSNTARRLALMLLPAALLTGCNSSMKEYREAYNSGQYEQAYNVSVSAAGEDMPKKDELSWQLHGGSAAQLAGKAGEARKLFDYADNSFVAYDKRTGAEIAGDVALSMLVNDTVMPYQGTIADRVMTHTYKALACLEIGDERGAKEEFARINIRQEEAVNKFRSEIASQIAEEEKARQKNNFAEFNIPDSTTLYKNPAVGGKLSAEMANFQNYKAYGNFANPFSTYISGIYAWHTGDTARADNLLKKSLAMSPSTYLARDLVMSKKGAANNQVWVIFENGLCPEMNQIWVPLPTGIVSKNLLVVPFAFPYIKERPVANNSFYVIADGKNHEGKLLCSMDGIIWEEFKGRIPGIATREIVRTLIKSVGQYYAGKAGGLWASVGVAAFQVATTGADTRHWETLPKNFYVVSAAIPADRKLKIKLGPQSVETEVTIPDCKNAIVHCRTPYGTAQHSVVRVIPLGTGKPAGAPVLGTPVAVAQTI